ncbi:hypothetical protein L6R50_28125 [Myxococcota bacterium]|nr:hypothetical protein [Myxococcota bacterium]
MEEEVMIGRPLTWTLALAWALVFGGDARADLTDYCYTCNGSCAWLSGSTWTYHMDADNFTPAEIGAIQNGAGAWDAGTTEINRGAQWHFYRGVDVTGFSLANTASEVTKLTEEDLDFLGLCDPSDPNNQCKSAYVPLVWINNDCSNGRQAPDILFNPDYSPSALLRVPTPRLRPVCSPSARSLWFTTASLAPGCESRPRSRSPPARDGVW